MDAVKFFKEIKRMCENHDICDDCPMGKMSAKTTMSCLGYCKKEPETAVAIVEEWNKAHPRKTFLTDFLEKHPNAPLDGMDDTPKFCPHHLGYTTQDAKRAQTRAANTKCRGIKCVDCWNTPMEEEK